MVSVTGSSPGSSLLGNALERGAGTGPYADRAAYVCGFDVVLPTGEFARIGFGGFPEAKAAKPHRWGVGPYLDGLFAQSNLGIVTGMTMWLAPRPNYFQSCFFGIDDDSRLEGVIEALRPLQMQGMFRAGLTIRNDYNVLSRMQQYPWEALDGETPLPPEMLQMIRKSFWRDAWWSSLWIGWIESYSASRELGLAERTTIERTLYEKVDRLVFVDDEDVVFARWEEGGNRKAAGHFAPPERRPEDRTESAALGVPDESNLYSTYWRKKTPPPPENLDRDR